MVLHYNSCYILIVIKFFLIFLGLNYNDILQCRKELCYNKTIYLGQKILNSTLKITQVFQNIIFQLLQYGSSMLVYDTFSSRVGSS